MHATVSRDLLLDNRPFYWMAHWWFFVAILGICLLLSLLPSFGTFSLFRLIGIGAALVYLLDVRVGLKDLTDGKGFW